MRGADIELPSARLSRQSSLNDGDIGFGDDDDDDDEKKPSHSSSLISSTSRAVSTSLHEAWRLYLMQVPRLSEQGAMSISQHYPSFRSLMNAYGSCHNEKEREKLLQDIPLNNTSKRRLGPALSKFIYQCIFTKSHENIQAFLQANQDSAAAAAE